MEENPEFSDPDKVIQPKTLQELIDELHKVFAGDKVNVEYVQELMTSYKSNPKEWKTYAKFDPHRYTRNLVDEGNGKFNLILLCWGEGQGSSIHSHANAHCFLKVMDGTIKETLYDWPSDGEQEMVPNDCRLYSKDSVTYINDDLGLHRVENPSHLDGAVSLHLYSPPFDMCDCFDQRSGHKRTVRMTFWSKYGKRTPLKLERVPCAVVSGTKGVQVSKAFEMMEDN